jgi:hypothetical protein
MECRKIRRLNNERRILMASTDFTPARNAAASPFLRAVKDRGFVVLLFVTAFAIHIAVLFNLLPA